ncbi:NAD(P)-dependent oxidoreductase [Pseudolabrys taiwanensis]|uniref:NAD(P)-dependent oxidoreductase n=1 Tax=Pseudolabrys taiwanensis TaxID=331696 RepID=A0A345ZQ49_9HYPH|nr:NAD(P)-dependent oxidoreductase [Pseudolabrys taiwanensis]AXK79046.1 NAD(P)-dependent oxidoreductase [Pseudolabrys taiwanensis]
MDILVTGASGFSGSHLVRTLLARGHRVTALIGRSRGRLDPALVDNPALTVLPCDLSAPGQSLPPRVDAIVHAAARSPMPGITAAGMVRDNTQATANLITYATGAGAKTFVYLSSLSIYGSIADPEVDETTPIVNPDAYGMTKLLGELMLREIAALRSVSIRLPGVVGPNSVRNWLTGVIERARAEEDITVFNPDALFNNAIHVDDLSTFVADLVESKHWNSHDALTVGASKSISVLEAIETLLRALGSSSRVRVNAERRPSFLISSKKAQQKYGYVPVPIADVLRRIGMENRPSVASSS